MEQPGKPEPVGSQSEAQRSADRIRLLCQELATPELKKILELSPEQQRRFDGWAHVRLAELASQFDVDVNASQRRASWGMRIASTLGGLASCAAIVLFFMHYWGNLGTPAQVVLLVTAPFLALAGAEFAAARERTPYFTGLLALVAFASFVMNLSVIGTIFNINSTERALLAWGAFAIVLAYRYGLRLLLAIGLISVIAYAAAATSAVFGYRWLDFYERPELVAFLALLIFCVPLSIRHRRRTDFPSVYRLVGLIVFFVCVRALADQGSLSYLPLGSEDVARLYESLGLLISAGGIWLGIRRQWNGVVNASAAVFVIFLFARLYHWWWRWMPKYLFFAAIGALSICLLLIFKRMRSRIAPEGAQP